MRLDAMLEGFSSERVPQVHVAGLQYDSRKLRPGEAFFAFPGERVDGHSFVPQALESGASAVVSERAAPRGLRDCWARVSHGRRALAHASLRFYDHPDRDLAVTAVTGTNGKTTTVHLIDSLLRSVGRTTALLGTIKHRVGTRSEKAVNTTPESLDIVRLLASLRQIGGTHATMEASSHALALERISGMGFHTAVFTNLTPEHLDFHGDMERYAAAKRLLFEGAGARPPRFAVVNADDPTGRSFLGVSNSTPVTYGCSSDADVQARDVVSDFRGLRFDAKTPAGSIRVDTSLVGDFNVENLLAAIAAAQCHGLAVVEIERGLRSVRAVPGRFERVDQGQPFLAVVDYAHTEDALRRLIESARTIVNRNRRSGRVLTLFGCGGNRDRSKRAPMGKVAGQLSDFAMLTSDNPRNEDPIRIIDDVRAGLRFGTASWATEPDRAKAIGAVLREARAGDVVLIAGKGHESTQTLASGTVEFDDREVTRTTLGEMGYERQ